MGEAKQRQKEWVRLFEPPSRGRMAISRPGARPVSVRKYERSLFEFIAGQPHDKPALCFNLKCNSELKSVPDVYLFVQLQKNVSPVGMGVCVSCARYSDNELRAIAREQFTNYLGLHQQIPVGAARVELTLPAGIRAVIEGVPFYIIGTEIPAGAAFFIELLEAQKLKRFIAFRQGVSNCHSIVHTLRGEIEEAGAKQSFAFKRGFSGILRSEYDPDGMHSWIEIDGIAIDAANGAERPIIIMNTDAYYDLMRISDVRDIEPPPKGQQEEAL